MGELNLLPASTLSVLQAAEAATCDHRRLLLNVGVGYGGRQEILDAITQYLADCFHRGATPEEILRGLTADTIETSLPIVSS